MGGDETPGAWTSLVLLERYRGGDDSAAEALFARYFERLTRWPGAGSRPGWRGGPIPKTSCNRSTGASSSACAKADTPSAAAATSGVCWPPSPSTSCSGRSGIRPPAAGRSRSNRPSIRSMRGALRGREREPAPEEALALADELEWVFARLDSFGRRVLELRLQGLADLGDRRGHRACRALGPPGPGPDPRHSSPNGSPMTDDGIRIAAAPLRERPGAGAALREIADFLADPAAAWHRPARVPAACRADRHRPGIPLAGPRPGPSGRRWRAMSRDSRSSVRSTDCRSSSSAKSTGCVTVGAIGLRMRRSSRDSPGAAGRDPGRVARGSTASSRLRPIRVPWPSRRCRRPAGRGRSTRSPEFPCSRTATSCCGA